jgi:hypothetical protein
MAGTPLAPGKKARIDLLCHVAVSARRGGAYPDPPKLTGLWG